MLVRSPRTPWSAPNRWTTRAAWSVWSPVEDPVGIVDGYTRQCSLLVTARDLALMAATLANRGVNPLTGERVGDAGRHSGEEWSGWRDHWRFRCAA